MAVGFGEVLSIGAKYVKPRGDKVKNDFVASFVHSKFAYATFLSLSVISGLSSWFSTIECTKSDLVDVSTKILEQWCYANSTFIVEGIQNPSPMPHIGNSGEAGTNVVYLQYYQWVTVALLLQALGFQIPRIIWKCFEKRRVEKIALALKDLHFVDQGERNIRISRVANYFVETREENRNYFLYFAACQFLYFFNAVFQIMFVQSFLQGRFITLLPKWLAGEPELDRVFPKLAKCQFGSFGLSGGSQKVDVLCVLAMNVVFEKIYLIVWFLLFFCLIIALSQFIQIVALFTSETLRIGLLKEKNLTKVHRSKIFGHDDFLILLFLRQSLDCLVFKDFFRSVQGKALNFKNETP